MTGEIFDRQMRHSLTFLARTKQSVIMKRQFKAIVIANFVLEFLNVFALEFNDFSAFDANDMIMMPFDADSFKKITMTSTRRFLNYPAFQKKRKRSIHRIA